MPADATSGDHFAFSMTIARALQSVLRPLDQPAELQTYYRDPTVVGSYLRRRTAQPLNGLLHRAQVRFINQVIRELHPARMLELAPGPARLTAELQFRGLGVAVDASAPMLEAARARLREHGGNWTLLQGDAFALPLADQSVDLVLTLKLIRHFRFAERLRLYNEIRRVLKPTGALVIDAQNRAVSLAHRMQKGIGQYPIYDALYDREELIAELEAVGFSVVRLDGLLRHFTVQARINRLRRLGLTAVARGLLAIIEALPGNNPSTWMVLSAVRH